MKNNITLKTFSRLFAAIFPLLLFTLILAGCASSVNAWGHSQTVKQAKDAVMILGEVVGNKVEKVYAQEYEDGSYLLTVRLFSAQSLRGKGVHVKPGLKAARDILRAGGADTQTYIERRAGGYWYIEISGCFTDDICNNGEK